MSVFKGLIVVAALAASTSTMAAPSHLSDVQYMQAARCQALIAAPALGKGDTTAIDALVKSEGQSRIPFVYGQADEMRQDAARSARNAGPMSKAALVAERDGACATFNGGLTTAATARPVTAN